MVFVIYKYNQQSDTVHSLRNSQATPSSGEAIEQLKLSHTADVMYNYFGTKMNICTPRETEIVLLGDTQKKWMNICTKVHVQEYS